MIYFINASQGFVKTTCNTVLINLIDKWLKEIDKGNIIGAIFFELRKAFDIVDPELLLKKKLAVYNFSAKSLSWIQSYLGGRQQCIANKTIK